ncbi:MAG: cation-translocating P-type ATPase, partial [Thermomicrobiales bacterium]
TLTVAADEPDNGDMVRAIGGAVERAGYSANFRVDGSMRSAAMPAWWKNRKLVYAAPAFIAWLIALALEHAFDQSPLAIGLFLITILFGGYPIFRAAWASLRARRIDMNVLMTISVVGAAALGDWSEGGLVVVLFTLGTTLQSIAFDHTRRAIRNLLDLSPDEALVVRNGSEVTVRTATLIANDIVRVRPGDRIPADGTVLSGVSSINQAAITGESIPVHKAGGDDVFSGTVNGTGSMLITVSRPSSESTLSNIVRLVEEAQARKAPSQVLVDKFASYYTPAVMVVAALIAVLGFAFASDSGMWTYRALVLLVVACPCALVISTPVSIVSAIGAATRSGILVKGGAALELFGQVKTIAFDKTGTLTHGRPAVVAITPFTDGAESDLLALAAAVEQESEHPLARAIIARALHDEVVIPASTGFVSRTGLGASATIDDRTVWIGSDRLLRQLGIDQADLDRVGATAEHHAGSGRSVVSIAEASVSGTAKVLGVIAIADRVRPGTAGILAGLRQSGIRQTVMLTGDRQIVAQAIAREVGVDQVRADLLPEDKIAAIEELQKQGELVAMIGDGVNDAPALATADIGIAMGISGSDIALESADLALMQDDLSALQRLHDLSIRTRDVIRQNIVLSLITKVLALGLGALGFVSLWIAVLVDVGTSLIVTANGMRLARNIEVRTTAASAPMDEACGCGEDHSRDEPGHVHSTAA